jgi:peptidyl-prolyl cis-trans isomerase C
MSSSTSFSRPLLLLALPILTLGLLAGCGNGNGTSAESEGDDIPYQTGESLTDSTVALVVSSEYGTDTLSAQNFRRQLQMAMRRSSPSQRSSEQMQETQRKLIRGFARQHTLRGEAKAQNIDVEPSRVSARLKKLKQRYKSEKQFRRQLAQNNLTIDSVRSMLADRLRQQVLQKQMAEDYAEPSPEEVESYSKENRRIRAQHILLKVGQNAPQSKVDSVRQVAKTLVDSAKMESVNFADLARRQSQGPSAQKGGDLGFFTRNQMVDKFAEAAYALSDSGDVAPEPVRTQYGFHVIRLTNPGEPMDTTKARKQMTQERRKQAVEDQVNELLKKVTVRANPDLVSAGLYSEE